MQKISNTVKYRTVNGLLSETDKITWRGNGQVVRLSTAGD